MKTRIFAFHLLNDFSGSPKVLSQLLQVFVKNGWETHVCTSTNTQGFLSNLKGISYYHVWYKFHTNPWIRLVYFAVSQLIAFFKMMFVVKKTDVIYINTVLPFGGAWLGKFKGCKVVYYIHESTINPKLLKWFLLKTVKFTACQIINVSDFVANSHKITTVSNTTIYNAISNSFVANKLPKEKKQHEAKNILMICSLKAYKGVFEFLDLARSFETCYFKLVLNDSQENIIQFFEKEQMPKNIQWYPSQKDVHPFYAWADIVLNLSRPDGWVETFGLTIIEAMAYGLPCIVPPVGGITEVVEDEVTGFMVDCRNTDMLENRLRRLVEDEEKYKQFSKYAEARVSLFSEDSFAKKNIALLSSLN